MDETSEEEAHSHDKQQVGQDGTKHGGLYHRDLTILECDDADLLSVSVAPVDRNWSSTHNQFNRVSKGGVEKSAHGLAQLQGDFFGRKRENGGERDDGEEIDGKDGSRAPAHHTSDNANGHHGQ